MIPSLIRNRRRRFTLAKWLLIATAFVGVLLWIAQFRASNDIESQGLVQGPNPIAHHQHGLSSSDDQKDASPLSKPRVIADHETNIDVPKSDLKTNDNKQKAGVKSDLDEEINNNKEVQEQDVKDVKDVGIGGVGFGQIAPPAMNQESGSNLNKKTTTTTASSARVGVIPGLGEMGVPVILKDGEKAMADKMFEEAAFNVYISDRISPNRSVPDARNSECKHLKYDSELPPASVVIIFHNEILSALMRTIRSVLNRTPSRMLEEIILVDDNSDRKELKSSLVNELQTNFPSGKVKLIRLSRREGLIRARLAGAKLAVGKVLVFLDSHCEVNLAWLEPLLQKIKTNPKAVVCPIIDIIDDKTLEYQISGGDYFQIGGFTWGGYFSWIDIPAYEEKRRKSSVEPARSPTMAGGLFAISRKYFWEIGSYDKLMDTWGGENLEMSFRVWMCGGELLIVPCSHVGHIFRAFHPYKFPNNIDSHGINTVRTVEVWMDEYKKYFYFHRPDLRNIDFGNIEERLKLRTNLKCHNFEWYLKNVYPDKFIWDRNVYSYGSVKNPNSRLCLDTLGSDESSSHDLGASPCNQENEVNINQFFSFSNNGELRREENCASVSSHRFGFETKVTMEKCDDSKSQKWIHRQGGPIVNVASGKCLDSGNNPEATQIFGSPCHGGHSQIWWFEHYLHINLHIDREQL